MSNENSFNLSDAAKLLGQQVVAAANPELQKIEELQRQAVEAQRREDVEVEALEKELLDLDAQLRRIARARRMSLWRRCRPVVKAGLVGATGGGVVWFVMRILRRA